MILSNQDRLALLALLTDGIISDKTLSRLIVVLSLNDRFGYAASKKSLLEFVVWEGNNFEEVVGFISPSTCLSNDFGRLSVLTGGNLMMVYLGNVLIKQNKTLQVRQRLDWDNHCGVVSHLEAL